MLQYLLAIVLIVLVYFFTSRKRDSRLPPGIHGWPIIGSIPSLKIPFLDQIEENQKKFGDVFFWRIGVRNNVYLCDAKTIRKAFNNPHLIDRPDDHFSFDSWSFFTKMGIINGNGQHWKDHRKFALKYLGDSGFGKPIVEDIIYLETETLIMNFKRHFLNGKAACIPKSLSLAPINVIWKLSSGIRFEEGDEVLEDLIDSMTMLFTLIQGAINLLDIYPCLVRVTPKFVMDRIRFTQLQECRKCIKDYIKSVVDERKASLNRENPCGLIDHYLMKIENDKSGENGAHFHERALIMTLGDLMTAGSETTSWTIRWALYMMANHQEIQRKIQKEIDSIVPRERLPSIDDKPRLPLTEATVCEVMRYATLVPVGLFHAASEDTMIEHYFIPKGTIVSAVIERCHRDPKYWKNPNEFDPQNFLDSHGNFIPNEAFMPFSTGRRVCLGENLARVELFLFISALLQKFSFRTAEEEENSSVGKDPQNVIFNLLPDLKFIVQERYE